MQSHKIPHRRILVVLQSPSDASRSITEIYRREILPIKTRTIHLLGRKCSAKILHTLLGFEVQASYKRIQCPDMVTARYLKLFSEIGCHRIRLPYDPTVTAKLILELESAQERLYAGVRRLFPRNRSLQLYILRKMCAVLRAQLAQLARENAQSPTSSSATTGLDAL